MFSFSIVFTFSAFDFQTLKWLILWLSKFLFLLFFVNWCILKSLNFLFNYVNRSSFNHINHLNFSNSVVSNFRCKMLCSEGTPKTNFCIKGWNRSFLLMKQVLIYFILSWKTTYDARIFWITNILITFFKSSAWKIANTIHKVCKERTHQNLWSLVSKSTKKTRKNKNK